MKNISIKLNVILLMVLSPTWTYANRYFDDCENGCSGSDPFLNALFAVVYCIAAYGYLLISYLDWGIRKAAKEKPIAINGVFEWSMALLGYTIVALGLAFPLIYIGKIFGGIKGVEDALFVFCISLAVLTYFKRN